MPLNLKYTNVVMQVKSISRMNKLLLYQLITEVKFLVPGRCFVNLSLELSSFNYYMLTAFSYTL